MGKLTLPQNIRLPHLNYLVRVKLLKEKPTGYNNCHAYTEYISKNESHIYLPSKATPGMIAHEVMHALGNICEARSMLLEKESEHMAYMMQYLLNNILGYVWK